MSGLQPEVSRSGQAGRLSVDLIRAFKTAWSIANTQSCTHRPLESMPASRQMASTEDLRSQRRKVCITRAAMLSAAHAL